MSKILSIILMVVGFLGVVGIVGCHYYVQTPTYALHQI
jgi:hypothetical protein